MNSIVTRILTRALSAPLPSTVRIARSAYIVTDFLSGEAAEKLRQSMLRRCETPQVDWEESWAASRFQFFNDPQCLDHVERARSIAMACLGRHLVFSYNYVAIYPHEARLARHRDRVGCDVNFLIFLGSSDCDRDQLLINLEIEGRIEEIWAKAGDVVIFEGRNVSHHRDARPVTDFVTAILHYEYG